MSAAPITIELADLLALIAIAEVADDDVLEDQASANAVQNAKKAVMLKRGYFVMRDPDSAVETFMWRGPGGSYSPNRFETNALAWESIIEGYWE